MTKEKKILMTGGTFDVPENERREYPRLTFFPMSLNAQKAHACLRISSLEYSTVEKNVINYPEDNQKLDYARLNPNMTIPVLEIDDKLLTDSREIQKYLCEKYPGKGDANADKKDMEAFIDTVCNWDEYLFSYRRIPALMGAAMHNIRQVCQVEEVNKAVNEGVLDERLRDGQTIREAYVKKIAQTRAMVHIGTGEETPELAKRIEENDTLLDDIFQKASTLLAKSDEKRFLLGDGLCSADAYFASVLARVEDVDSTLLNTKFDSFSGTREWWAAYKAAPESDVFFRYPNNKAGVAIKMLLTGKPVKIMCYTLGLHQPGKLPDDIESDVQDALKKMENEYLE